MLEQRGFSRSLFGEEVESDGFRVPLVAFSHRPFDTRTACLAALPPSHDSAGNVSRCFSIGAPLVFVGSNAQWDVWFQTQSGPKLWWPKHRGSIAHFFREIGQRVTPGAIFRAKTLARLNATEQLEFVDLGAFELIERRAGQHLTSLVTSMILTTSDKLGWDEDGLSEKKSQWLVRANFWLLAARILHDKKVENFRRLDLDNIEDVFRRVRRHYGADFGPSESSSRISALTSAVAELKRSPSLRLVSTEALADPFENALITKETRRAHGTHSTPGWLVEYMLGRLRPWIEELSGAGRSQVFEPACGHAPFLLGALRLLSSLPACRDLDDVQRHTFLKQRLHGSERDDFAREVARLSLTLADIPNPNGWNLGRDGDHDLFEHQRLERGVKAADIILCNPPFEADKRIAASHDELFRIKQAAEILRRTAVATPFGAVLGFVIPQSMLDSHKLVDLRRQLARDFEWLEICRLPDGIFEKADAETAVILGRRHPGAELKLKVGPTSFRHVLDGDEYRRVFREEAKVTTEQLLSVDRVAPPPSHILWVPDMLDVWDVLKENPCLGDIADLGQGFSFKSENDVSFPPGEKQTSLRAQKGYGLGFFNLDRAPETHLLPPTVFLNRNELAIARPRAGFQAGISQVVMGYHPASRGPWRNHAYLDVVGHPATSSYLLIRPKIRPFSEIFLWALLNSPLCNAYTASHFAKRNITVGKLRLFRVPSPTVDQISAVEAAATKYREAATRWTLLSRVDESSNVKTRRKKHHENTATLPGIGRDETNDVSQLLELKYLHWRIDAEVLKLYNLPPVLERQVIDYFTNARRVGVPFDQTGYFPQGFEGAERLSELLAITADWPKCARREARLIKREYEEDGLPPELLKELEQLQRLGALRLKLVSPLDRAELDAEIARLKREGKWTE